MLWLITPLFCCPFFFFFFCLSGHRLGNLVSCLCFISVFNVIDKEGKKIKDEATLSKIEDYIRKV